MSKVITLLLIVVVLIALAMFALGLSDALRVCSGKLWINCDWNHVQLLGVWLIPVLVALVVGIGRLITNRGKK